MFSASSIDPSVVQAYLETDYFVHGSTKFGLRVGHKSADLLALHDLHMTDCSAFLTAWNPFSKPFGEAENSALQTDLANQLSLRSLVFLPGMGQHPSNQWPGEESFLVLGLTLEAAKVMGTRFEQNAFIWNGADGVPQLILLR